MGNDIDLSGIGAIGFDEDVPALARHDDEAPRCSNDCFCDLALIIAWPVENGVKRSDQWHLQRRNEVENEPAGFPAEYSELVLQADEVETLPIYEFGCVAILLRIILVDPEPNRGRIVMDASRVAHDDNGGFGNSGRGSERQFKVCRECRYAAAARQGVTDKCNPE